jgi:hypothetical protein
LKKINQCIIALTLIPSLSTVYGNDVSYDQYEDIKHVKYDDNALNIDKDQHYSFTSSVKKSHRIYAANETGSSPFISNYALDAYPETLKTFTFTGHGQIKIRNEQGDPLCFEATADNAIISMAECALLDEYPQNLGKQFKYHSEKLSLESIAYPGRCINYRDDSDDIFQILRLGDCDVASTFSFKDDSQKTDAFFEGLFMNFAFGNVKVFVNPESVGINQSLDIIKHQVKETLEKLTGAAIRNNTLNDSSSIMAKRLYNLIHGDIVVGMSLFKSLNEFHYAGVYDSKTETRSVLKIPLSTFNGTSLVDPIAYGIEGETTDKHAFTLLETMGHELIHIWQFYNKFTYDQHPWFNQKYRAILPELTPVQNRSTLEIDGVNGMNAIRTFYNLPLRQYYAQEGNRPNNFIFAYGF